MVVLKNLLKNRYTQAVLQGLKPCIIGIILSTGVFMILNSAFNIAAEFSFDWKVVVLTVLLTGIMFGSKPVLKKKISPVMLIVISAVLGVAAYGL